MEKNRRGKVSEPEDPEIVSVVLLVGAIYKIVLQVNDESKMLI